MRKCPVRGADDEHAQRDEGPDERRETDERRDRRDAGAPGDEAVGRETHLVRRPGEHAERGEQARCEDDDEAAADRDP